MWIAFICIKVISFISKLKNARKYFIHQITKKLVLENDIIVSETLKVKEMLEEKKISKFLSDASLSKICSVLKSKAEYYGKRYIQIDTYYPSSQKCSRCGYQNEKVKDLTVRDWICPKCGSYYDRDILKELGNTCKNLYRKNRKQRRIKSTAATVGS